MDCTTPVSCFTDFIDLTPSFEASWLSFFDYGYNEIRPFCCQASLSQKLNPWLSCQGQSLLPFLENRFHERERQLPWSGRNQHHRCFPHGTGFLCSSSPRGALAAPSWSISKGNRSFQFLRLDWAQRSSGQGLCYCCRPILSNLQEISKRCASGNSDGRAVMVELSGYFQTRRRALEA